LAKVAKKMEGYFGCAQDVEWCVANDIPFPENIFLVQTRPESVWSKKKQAPLLGEKTGLELLFAQATTPIKVKF
jgi:phosphoenolpyruvate synthase/pyruvate phosphate dikinase